MIKNIFFLKHLVLFFLCINYDVVFGMGALLSFYRAEEVILLHWIYVQDIDLEPLKLVDAEKPDMQKSLKSMLRNKAQELCPFMSVDKKSIEKNNHYLELRCVINSVQYSNAQANISLEYNGENNPLKNIVANVNANVASKGTLQSVYMSMSVWDCKRKQSSNLSGLAEESEEDSDQNNYFCVELASTGSKDFLKNFQHAVKISMGDIKMQGDFSYLNSLKESFNACFSKALYKLNKRISKNRRILWYSDITEMATEKNNKTCLHINKGTSLGLRESDNLKFEIYLKKEIESTDDATLIGIASPRRICERASILWLEETFLNHEIILEDIKACKYFVIPVFVTILTTNQTNPNRS